MKTIRLIAVLAMLGMHGPALAESTAAEAAEPASSSQQIINVTVYGNDSCPAGQGDEIVVCARQPESERYRIPKGLREKSEPSGSESWTSRVAAVEDSQRDMLPTGCSILSNSGAGCLAKALRLWRAERQLLKRESQP